MAIFLGKQYLGQKDSPDPQDKEDDTLTAYLQRLDADA